MKLPGQRSHLRRAPVEQDVEHAWRQAVGVDGLGEAHLDALLPEEMVDLVMIVRMAVPPAHPGDDRGDVRRQRAANRVVDVLDLEGPVDEATLQASEDHRVGVHWATGETARLGRAGVVQRDAGAGPVSPHRELRLGRHAAGVLRHRYRRVDAGGPVEDREVEVPGGVPLGLEAEALLLGHRLQHVDLEEHADDQFVAQWVDGHPWADVDPVPVVVGDDLQPTHGAPPVKRPVVKLQMLVDGSLRALKLLRRQHLAVVVTEAIEGGDFEHLRAGAVRAGALFGLHGHVWHDQALLPSEVVSPTMGQVRGQAG